MKDSVTAERITNARLPDTVHAEHTHIPAGTQFGHTPTDEVGKHKYSLSRQRLL